jgi:peptidoglycan hydrolase-like protein with peptidoglycan-binding domain
MWGVRFVMMVGGLALLGGCAGARSHQELARLQSQVGLLDSRVSQLERVGMGEISTAPVSEAAMEGGATTTLMKESARVSDSSGKALKVASKSSAKPSTREIQQALKNAGFYQGTVDGKIGSQTREAIKEFQRVHGLKDDGVVGKQTWAKLNVYVDLSTATPEPTTTTALK